MLTNLQESFIKSLLQVQKEKITTQRDQSQKQKPIEKPTMHSDVTSPQVQDAPLSWLPGGGIDADAVCHAALDNFTRALESQRFWHIVPATGDTATAFYDAQTGLRYPSISALENFIQEHPFLHVRDQGSQYQATLQTATRRLWATHGEQNFSSSDGKLFVDGITWGGLSNWRLPTKDYLESFARARGNPHSQGQPYRLNGHDIWLTVMGGCDVDNGQWAVLGQRSGRVFACNHHWTDTRIDGMLADLAARCWQLVSPDGNSRFAPDTAWQDLDHAHLIGALREAGLHLLGLDGETRINTNDPFAFLPLIDHTPCRLPRLEPVQYTDPHKGLWELWGNDAARLKDLGLVARDPARDVCSRNVAIDFGTSSTVVALNDAHGGRRLLRIGVRDFYQPPRGTDFENPTVLEIIDQARLSAVWTAQTYRPALDWNWVHAAHEAQASFRDNPGDTAVLASILPRLKQWALRSAKEALRLTDRQGLEIELPAMTERNPVRGQPMTVSPLDPFDPIELYAWFLGMAINWRGHGLYLKYHLTFPVKYPRETKDKILASFRRGLQRSLPLTLVTQPDALQGFTVEEIASEPAAYAAAALPQLDLEPTDEGVPYAVFDFGGGTTDFDYGLWRWATDDEFDEGYSQVVEHLHSSGDNFLGGENLLEHLVYACFRHNLAVCREHRIHFTRPLDGERFTGDEAFVHATQAAQTNTVLLAAKLRRFLESEDGQLDPQLKIDLLDQQGHKVPCELSLDRDKLDALLFTRMENGVRAFLRELAAVRNKLPAGQPVHVLLAGNGSRSRHITTLFDADDEYWSPMVQEVFGNDLPELIVHAPLPIDEDDHHAPTAKTGVALGLLRLCPGEGVKLLDHVRSEGGDEAPFRYFVGKLGRREEFTPTLTPQTPYQQWHLLGPLPQGVFKLCASISLRARTGMRQGDPELRIQRLDFPGTAAQDRLFARAIGPSLIELAVAPDESALSDHLGLLRRTLDLETC